MRGSLSTGDPRVGYDSSGIDDGLVYYTAQYGSFLMDLLGAQSDYLLAGPPEAPVGLLPLLTKEGPLGAVANALPFFGSHGAPVVARGGDDLVGDLLDEVESGIGAGRWSSVTLVENPFHPIDDEITRRLRYLAPVDERISQITHWDGDPPGDLEGLLGRFHVKHRNAIRKGRSTGQVVELASRQDEWEFLAVEHERGMDKLGGRTKGRDVFDGLRRHLAEWVRLHCGYVDGRISAALLSIRYGSTVEYFVPVVDPERRSDQVLPHLISVVMLSDLQSGATAWNWGGTWSSQTGVFRFKDRFGATNRPYRYLHWCDTSIASADESALLREYPYWYTRRFG